MAQSSELDSCLHLVEPIQRRRLTRDAAEVSRRWRNVGRVHLLAILQRESLSNLEIPQDVGVPLIQAIGPDLVEIGRKDTDMRTGGQIRGIVLELQSCRA